MKPKIIIVHHYKLDSRRVIMNWRDIMTDTVSEMIKARQFSWYFGRFPRWEYLHRIKLETWRKN